MSYIKFVVLSAVVFCLEFCIVTAQGCQKDECSVNGNCYRNNEIWQDGCTAKKCITTNTSWRTEIHQIQCKDKDGSCVSNGKAMSAYGPGCTCIVENNGWRMDGCGTTSGCQKDECPINGNCYRNNEIWQEDCTTKKCITTQSGNKFSWTSAVHLIQCKDKDGYCVDNGEAMSAYGPGCTCIVENNGWRMDGCGSN